MGTVSAPCSCLCDNCKIANECHYSSYHCKHWIREYGDVEGYGLCLIQVLSERPRTSNGNEAEKLHDEYFLARVPWYKAPIRQR
jgi:hypothetical protein